MSKVVVLQILNFSGVKDGLSNNAPAKRDVLGTILLSVLEGHTRYAHICSLVSAAI